MRSLRKNNYASAVPLILFLITIFACGALYTLLFIEIAIPTFDNFIPASDAKTLTMMGIYGIPLFILVVGMIAIFLAALRKKQEVYYQ